MDFLSTFVLLLILMDPLGSSPAIMSLLNGFTSKQRTHILVRELLVVLVILLIFMLVGNPLMNFLGLKDATLHISGGILLFMIAIGMVFPVLSLTQPHVKEGQREDPFIVPIAIPLIAGPATIAIVLLNSSHAGSSLEYLVLGGAIVSAWIVSSIIILSSQYILKFLGEKGLIAMERLMGMVLILIAVQMFMNGLKIYNP